MGLLLENTWMLSPSAMNTTLCLKVIAADQVLRGPL